MQGADWPDEGGMTLFGPVGFDSDDAVPPFLIAGDGSLPVLVSTDGERRFAFRWACG